MPVILTVAFFISAPAGLVLYWMVSNLVGVGQQYIINRLNPTNPPAAATDTSGSDGPETEPRRASRNLRKGENQRGSCKLVMTRENFEGLKTRSKGS